MSVAIENLRRALGQMMNDGGATVWAPNVTTGQAKRLPGLQDAVARAQGGEGRTYSDDDWVTIYRASSGDLPTADGWDERKTGSATATVAGGLLTITA